MLNQRSARPPFQLAVFCLVAATLGVSAAQSPAARPYFPPRGEWRKQEPAAVGLDKARLDEAIAFAIAHENSETKDLAIAIPNQFRNEAPHNTLIGPTQPRTGANGLIIRGGAAIAEWGDTSRADMTFSVTKTFLSTVVGLAFDRGQIRNVADRVATYMPTGVDLFASPQRSNHLGTPAAPDERLVRPLWGKPDWADRPPRNQTPSQWEQRVSHAPGTFYQYNDTRINVLALASLYLLKRPLPEVLDEAVMTPIAASSSWHSEACDNARVEIDKRRMKSVTEAGISGAVCSSTPTTWLDRYLFLQNGEWEGRQLISRKWIEMARSPGPANDGYGFCNCS